MTHRRDLRLRVRTLLPLPFFVGAGVRIGLSGGMTAVERALLLGTAGAYVVVVALVWWLEARRQVVTDDRGVRIVGRVPARERSLREVAWADVTMLRQRAPIGRGRGASQLELETAGGRLLLDSGWRELPALVRRCAEATTEPILARLEPQRAEGIVLGFGDVRVDQDALLFPLARGGLKRVRFSEVTGLRLHQGVLVFYLAPSAPAAAAVAVGTEADTPRWMLRPLSRLDNPYALMEMLLRGGAGKSPGPPPGRGDLPQS